MNLDWIFDAEKRGAFLAGSRFSDEFLAKVDQKASEIDANGRNEFLDIARRYVNQGEIPPRPPADPLWCAVLALTGHPRMSEEHRRRSIPTQVTEATALDVERWVKGVTASEHGIAAVPLAWLLKPIRENLLEIGRLQYLPKTFAYPYRIFSHRDHAGQIRALAESGICCSEEGWPSESGGQFETAVADDGDHFAGHPVDLSSGRILSKMEALPRGEWECVLEKGTPVLDVHIPAGGSLREDECKASLKAAAEIFLKCFPEHPWKAFVCTSWLIDPELGRCLPPHSGIVTFGRLFHPLAINRPNFRQLIERVLDNREDWQNFEPQTSLQKAVIAHLKAGHTFRTTSGFRLKTEGA